MICARFLPSRNGMTGAVTVQYANADPQDHLKPHDVDSSLPDPRIRMQLRTTLFTTSSEGGTGLMVAISKLSHKLFQECNLNEYGHLPCAVTALLLLLSLLRFACLSFSFTYPQSGAPWNLRACSFQRPSP